MPLRAVQGLRQRLPCMMVQKSALTRHPVGAVHGLGPLALKVLDASLSVAAGTQLGRSTRGLLEHQGSSWPHVTPQLGRRSLCSRSFGCPCKPIVKKSHSTDRQAPLLIIKHTIRTDIHYRSSSPDAITELLVIIMLLSPWQELKMRGVNAHRYALVSSEGSKGKPQRLLEAG